MTSTAFLSSDRLYRYWLKRKWGNGNSYAMFIGLNPSTADETKDDPTIRKCIGFSKLWGFDGLCMTNLFAWRATDPREMMKASSPIGPQNDMWLAECAKDASIIIAAWGVRGTYRDRGKIVRAHAAFGGATLKCLRKTKAGHPEHPLYIPYSVTPINL